VRRWLARWCVGFLAPVYRRGADPRTSWAWRFLSLTDLPSSPFLMMLAIMYVLRPGFEPGSAAREAAMLGRVVRRGPYTTGAHHFIPLGFLNSWWVSGPGFVEPVALGFQLVGVSEAAYAVRDGFDYVSSLYSNSVLPGVEADGGSDSARLWRSCGSLTWVTAQVNSTPPWVSVGRSICSPRWG
jgi:hypothetical protein